MIAMTLSSKHHWLLWRRCAVSWRGRVRDEWTLYLGGGATGKLGVIATKTRY
jgi:hypothetical protein